MGWARAGGGGVRLSMTMPGLVRVWLGFASAGVGGLKAYAYVRELVAFSRRRRWQRWRWQSCYRRFAR